MFKLRQCVQFTHITEMLVELKNDLLQRHLIFTKNLKTIIYLCERKRIIMLTLLYLVLNQNYYLENSYRKEFNTY